MKRISVRILLLIRTMNALSSCALAAFALGTISCAAASEQAATENQEKVVRGTNTTIERFPWFTSFYFGELLFRDENRTTPNLDEPLLYEDIAQCGGAILDEYTVLTAAHCVEDEVDSLKHADVAARYDENDFILGFVGTDRPGLDNARETAQQLKIRPEGVLMHPCFSDDLSEFDLAVIKLASPIEFGTKVQKIALVNNKDAALWKPLETAHIVGLGSTKQKDSEGNVATEAEGASPMSKTPVDDRNATILQTAEVVIQPKEKYDLTDSEQNMIAAIGANGEDSCQNDSGGPLSVVHQGNHLLLGIAAEAPRSEKYDVCGEIGLYASIPQHRAWIDSAMSGKPLTCEALKETATKTPMR